MQIDDGGTYFRGIPEGCPANRSKGRTDASVDALTNPDVREVEWVKAGCWVIVVDVADVVRALDAAGVSWAHRGGWRTAPFDIDIEGRTVAGVPCPGMRVLWRPDAA